MAGRVPVEQNLPPVSNYCTMWVLHQGNRGRIVGDDAATSANARGRDLVLSDEHASTRIGSTAAAHNNTKREKNSLTLTLIKTFSIAGR